jgi:diamine N-acetyltransferase
MFNYGLKILLSEKGKGVMIELEKLSYENYAECIQLKVAYDQKNFVADNIVSIIHAYLELEIGMMIPLPYVIKNDGVIIGFIMMSYCKVDLNDPTQNGEYCIWRFMIDEQHQGKGYGRVSLFKALDIIKTYPIGYSESVCLFIEKDNVKAQNLYKSVGFMETGETLDGEEKLRKYL